MKGCPACSERRPISRIGGRWCDGSLATCAAICAFVGAPSRAPRAPGRQLPPRGTEQAPGCSPIGGTRTGDAPVRGSRGLAGRSSLRSRSIGSCGRKSEATRVIASLERDGERIAVALADEFDRPAAPSHAGCRQWYRGRAGDPHDPRPAQYRRFQNTLSQCPRNLQQLNSRMTGRSATKRIALHRLRPRLPGQGHLSGR